MDRLFDDGFVKWQQLILKVAITHSRLQALQWYLSHFF
jgi:hypothetical protein